MALFDNNLKAIFFNGKAYRAAYLGAKLLWRKLLSCFSSGWDNHRGWSNDEGWNNN